MRKNDYKKFGYTINKHTSVNYIKYYRNSVKTPKRDIQLHKHHHRLDHSRYNILEGAAKVTEKEDEGGEGDEGKEEDDDNGEEVRTV